MTLSMPVGTIYKIISRNSDKIYIGSTTKTLIQRLSIHESDYRSYKRGKMNYITSFKILEYGQYHIELIESVEFDTKDELRKLEGYYIQTFKAICVNKNVAGQTNQESCKIYYLKNKDKIDQYVKAYYIQNRDKINKQKKEILTCSCGKTYTRGHKSHHEKTKFHIANFNIST